MRKLFYPLIVVALMACSKDRGHYHFYGRITEEITGAPVPNGLVTVVEEYDVGHSESESYGNVYTNGNGEYDFNTEMRHRSETNVELLVSQSAIGIVGKQIDGIFEESHNDITVKSHCLLEFSIYNHFPFDQHDSIFNIYIDRPTGPQYVIGGNPSFTGMSVSRHDTTSFFGFTANVLHYSVKKNNLVTQFTDTISTPDPYAVMVMQDSISY